MIRNISIHCFNQIHINHNILFHLKEIFINSLDFVHIHMMQCELTRFTLKNDLNHAKIGLLPFSDRVALCSLVRNYPILL